MLEIENYKNGHGYDCFKVNTNDGSFEISFQNNGDLYIRYILNESKLDAPDKKEFKITKENYFLYTVFDNLYKSIKTGKINGYFDVNMNINNQKRLFKDNKIDWRSDDFEYDDASRFVIEKIDDIYKVTIHKSKDNSIYTTYVIRFRNSGSRYSPFNITFMQMYQALKEYDYENEYHQVHIEEYMYKNSLVKKLKK